MIKQEWPDGTVWIDETLELTPEKKKQLEELIAPRLLAQMPIGMRFVPNPALHCESCSCRSLK